MTNNEIVERRHREAAADLLDEISNLLEHVGIGQVADLIRDGEYDEHDATQAFVKFEHDFLRSHPAPTTGSAGEVERMATAIALDRFRDHRPPVRWPTSEQDKLSGRDGTIPLEWVYAEECRHVAKVALAALRTASPSPAAEGDILDLADKAVTWALDSFGGYSTEEIDAGIHYMQARGKDRWSMQAQMEMAPCFGCHGTEKSGDEPCPICQVDPTPERTEPVEGVEKHPGLAMCSLHHRTLIRTAEMPENTWRCPACALSTPNAETGAGEPVDLAELEREWSKNDRPAEPHLIGARPSTSDPVAGERDAIIEACAKVAENCAALVGRYREDIAAAIRATKAEREER